MKKLAINILIMFVAIFLTGEIALRIVNPFIKVTKPPPYDTAVKDDLLGWKPKSNYHFEGRIKNEKDQEYDVTYNTVKAGFREFGNVNSRRPKIFFIGDSYTQSVESTDSTVFYDIIGQKTGAEIFAYGMAGWGSWQEYLALNLWMDSIGPDLIVLQTCSNDFIDNRAELERQSRYKVGLKRPYIGVGEREFHDWPVPLLAKLQNSSRFIAFIRNYWPKSLHRKRYHAEQRIAEEGKAYADYTDAVTVTGISVNRMIKLAGQTPILAFSSDKYEPQYSDMRQIANQDGIQWIEGVTDSIHAASDRGIVVHSFDGYHWTPAGQTAVASALLPFVQSAISN